MSLRNCVSLCFLTLSPTAAAQDRGGSDDVPVTIKELDVPGAIREFKEFQRRLEQYRAEIGEGRVIAQETSQILDDLRRDASADNDYNETPIFQAVTNYVDVVLQKQLGLVDFLDSQRYRITYYANKMASSVRPEHLALIFGTEEQNTTAIIKRVRKIDGVRSRIIALVDSLPPEDFDRETFRPTRNMPRATSKQINSLLYAYQQERNALEMGKKRLELVRAAKRSTNKAGALLQDFDADLLVGQMFGALDRIRLQMSMDFLFLENLLAGYAQSTRTQEILAAFQNLIELQGDLEGPSPELAGVLDWLQDSSARRLSDSARNLARPGMSAPRTSDLLREAYRGFSNDQQ